jgi:hypothetical protein
MPARWRNAPMGDIDDAQIDRMRPSTRIDPGLNVRDHALQRFPFILDHSVIEDERETL